MPWNRVLLVSAVALGTAAALTVVGAQTPQQDQRPVFRSGAAFVSVDAYPRRDGKIVEGLTKADFEIFEDGKPQAVDTFEFIRIAPFTPDAELRDPNTIADSDRQAADPHNRLFVIYLDIYHTGFSGAYYSREPIVSFLRRSIGPNDLFAVMTPEVPIMRMTFARRSETLEAELQKVWLWGGGSDLGRTTAEDRLLACGDPGLVHAFREETFIDSLDALVARLGGLRDERKNVLFFSEGWIPRRGAGPGGAGSKRPQVPRIGVGPGGKLGVGTDQFGNPDESWCNQQRARLGAIDYEQRFRDLLTRSRLANVTFHTVDLAGLRVDPSGSNAAKTDFLRTLADNTDGSSVVNTNNLVGGVRKIADDLSAFYLLGYSSTNPAADGKYRQIQVKVKAPNVKVSARRGYLAPTAAMLKAEADAARKPARVRTPVDDALDRLGTIRAGARLYGAAVPSTTGLDVAVEIGSADIETGQWNAGATATVTVSSKDGSSAPVSAKARIEAGARGTIVRVPIQGTRGRTWQVSAEVNGATEKLDVLEVQFDVTPESASILGEPLVFRATPSPRAVPQPAADPQFRRTERIHIEWPLGATLDSRVARLLGRQGDPLPVPVSLTERPDGDRLILAADLVLAPLAAGDYVIEISAEKGSEKFQRWLAFRVIR